jgi:cation:H+ antiporter
MAAVIVFVLANDVLIGSATTNLISRIDGIILILFFGAFLYYTINLARKSEALESMPDSLPLGKSILYIVLGLVGLVLGGKWIVDGAVTIAESFGVSQQIIGLTIVAVGTSLPELATSVVAAFKKQSDIAVGNIIGSNIFNIFWILGLSAVIVPLPFNTSANFDVLVMIGASLLLFLSLFLGKKGRLDRWQGVVYVLLYIVYIISFVVRI